MKQLTSFAFLLSLCVSVSLRAADINDLTYDASGATVTITDCDTGASGALVIPEIIEGKPVTTIGGRTFRFCHNLTSLTIPSSVTNIANEAFASCRRLLSIDVSAGNLNYVSEAGVLFNKTKMLLIQCPGAKSGAYLIPNGVTSIGYSAFSGCRSLTSVTIPEGVISIGSRAFSSCQSLSSITIPESVTDIGPYTFSGCSSLTSVVIPEGVTSIGNYTFLDCRSLTSVVIPEGVTTIGFQAFWGCSNLTSISLPDSVTHIEEQAFFGCSSLVDVTVGAGLANNGLYALMANAIEVTVANNAAEIATLEATVASNAAEITTLEATVASNAAEITTLEATATSNAAEIAALEAQVAELSQRPTLEQIQDVRAGSLVFVADPVTNQVRLSFTLEQTDDLVTWSPLVGGWWLQNADGSTLTRVLPLDEPKRLLRVTLEE